MSRLIAILLKPVLLCLVTSANRPAKLADFDENSFLVCQNVQNAQNLRFLKMAGNAIGQIFFF